MKSPSSVVKKKAEYIDFCNSAQVKTECFKYIKNAADLSVDQQSQISFLMRKFNSSAISRIFYAYWQGWRSCSDGLLPFANEERGSDSTILMFDL
jgi:hypothetical protein